MPTILRRVTASPILALFIGLLHAAHAVAEAAVWQVQRDDATLLLGGTVHILSRADYPLPDAYDIAFDRADILVFETDIAALADPRVQAQMAALSLLPPGTRLQDTISAETFTALSRYLESVGLSVALFEQMRPTMLAMTLSVLELQRLGVGELGVDRFYASRGAASGKTIEGLESIETHLSYLDGLARGKEDEFLRYTLEDMAELEPQLEQMMADWRSGDLAGLETRVLAPMREAFPGVYRSIIVERNALWLPQLEAMLDTPDIEFVLVGVAHLAGPDGLLAMLRGRGFEVTRAPSQ